MIRSITAGMCVGEITAVGSNGVAMEPGAELTAKMQKLFKSTTVQHRSACLPATSILDQRLDIQGYAQLAMPQIIARAANAASAALDQFVLLGGSADQACSTWQHYCTDNVMLRRTQPFTVLCTLAA